MLLGCSSSSPEIALSRGKLSVTLAGKGDCIYSGNVIDQNDITILSFELRELSNCVETLTIARDTAEGFKIEGSLGDIAKGRTYMVVVDHKAQWELRQRVTAS